MKKKAHKTQTKHHKPMNEQQMKKIAGGAQGYVLDEPKSNKLKR